ncbi:MaoC family dehydratase N-terminal domain-containing protein [Micrococcus terreus]|uniref:FAS1-like dehydratase domain-containing protein n=1 Tax=Micrococcus terreus TaxID=574650 RepID=UPI0021A7AD8F|nr:MaoC family dehydratase N-terminal domain-containing protein [Micrococcus terreus]MCT2087740.1 MaoC family dehydratase N-terminal domain-containing protein [Micrococcus terreus]MDK7701857.1 MaoC family dehydratase N-terminal domain-containing protein [Micrococcus terreus]WOO96443.1 MaoC family dehydratase N-terminal domain-containing protein [Micrococcus terreus]
MSVNPDVQGRSYPPSPPYLVSRERIREFAASVQATHPAHTDVAAAQELGHADLVAPPTFAVIIAQGAEAAAIQDPEANIDFSRVVHADERFTHHRPIVAGDELTATVTVESVKSLGGHSMITTRADIATTAGEPVSAVLSTLLVRGEES